MQAREKVEKSPNTVFLRMLCGSRASKLAKATGSGQMRDAKCVCTPFWRETHFEVKMHKTPGVRIIFGTWHVEKVHAVVARSTIGSQHVKNTQFSEHFWKLRC